MLSITTQSESEVEGQIIDTQEIPSLLRSYHRSA